MAGGYQNLGCQGDTNDETASDDTNDETAKFQGRLRRSSRRREKLLGWRVEGDASELGARVLPVDRLLLALRRRRVEAHQTPRALPAINHGQLDWLPALVSCYNCCLVAIHDGQSSSPAIDEITDVGKSSTNSWLLLSNHCGLGLPDNLGSVCRNAK
uniref:Uncharacterized protein n=1 Tax=Leersia perrieri TaxID=77586 RepID=A0A0D9UZR7_9ORYZ